MQVEHVLVSQSLYLTPKQIITDELSCTVAMMQLFLSNR